MDLLSTYVKFVTKTWRHETHLPKMPRKAAARKTHAVGNNFLQAIREKPAFVCTCCHRWLFQRCVITFDESKYDMENEIVKDTLDIKY